MKLQSPVLPPVLVATAVLTGCAIFDPPPQRERAELPDLSAVFAESSDSLPAPSVDWWRDFQSPELDALVSEALSANYDLRAAAERLAQAAAQAELAGVARRPQINAGLLAQRQRNVLIGIPIPGGDGPIAPTATTYGLSLDLTWELDLWGRLAAEQRAAELTFGAAEVDLAAAQLSIAGQVVKAWLAATDARLQLELAESGVEARERSLDLVRDRFAAGLAPRLEVDQSRAEVAGAKANVDLRLRALEAAVRQVELLLGRYPAGALEPGADLPAVPASIPGGLPAELLARRPDLVAAELRLRAADERFTSARAERFPAIALTASTGTRSEELDDLFDGDFRVWSLAGNLVQPIFQGGRIKANIALSDAVASEAAAGFANAVLLAMAEVEVALSTDDDLGRRVGHLEEAAVAARSAEDQIDERYRAGLENLLQVLIARRSRLDAESAWLDARRAWLDNRVDLYLALGGGFGAVNTEEND